jgi:hypothetical protein
MNVRSRSVVVVAVALALCLGVGVGSVAAEEKRVADGKLWLASTQAEKVAYLVGFADTVAVYRAILAKKGAAEPNAMARLTDAIHTTKADEAIRLIDGWYRDNPSRHDAPVLGVVWLAIVEPGKK